MLYAHVNSLLKMTTSQARFKWTDDKLIYLMYLIKCLQAFGSSYAKFSYFNIDNFQ